MNRSSYQPLSSRTLRLNIIDECVKGFSRIRTRRSARSSLGGVMVRSTSPLAEISRHAVPRSPTSGCAFKKATWRANRSGRQTSSPSIRAISAPRATRGAEAMIERRRVPRLGWSDPAQPRIAIVLQNGGRRVDRAVVDRDELEIAERLPEHAVDRLDQPWLGVADRHDD